MSRYQFELATERDDAELREILATPMSGAISISFRRDPSYFAAGVVDGRFRQVIVARDASTGASVGLGSRSVSPRYVNGLPDSIGYLSGLRVLPSYRNLGLVARGYAYFKRLHADGRTPLYLTTIAMDNHRALAMLTSGRAGLPTYHPWGEYHTLAIPVRAQRKHTNLPRGVEIRRATDDDLQAIVTFLSEVAPERQFFPCYKADDFGPGDGLLHGLQASDVLLATLQGRIVGTLGIWNQRPFRQTVIHGYSAGLAWLRPVYNCWARISGGPNLPRPQAPLRYVMGALPTVFDADPALFAALVQAALHEAADSEATHLLIGLHVDDPLLAALRSRRVTRYVTRLFLVCWEDGEPLRRNLDSRPPYLELGSL